MAHNLYSAGQVFVSSATQGVDLNLAGFEALTWTEVNPIVTTPSTKATQTGVGQIYLVGVEQTASGHTKVDGGDLVCGNIPDDPGQVILKAMAVSKLNRAFKFTHNTTLTAGTSVVETVYTRGIVLSDGDPGGGADDPIITTYTLAFNQLPIKDLP